MTQSTQHIVIDNIEKISSNNHITSMIATVISGVVVFILGQLFIELMIKPLRRYNEIRAKVAYSLVYFADLYYNPVDNKVSEDESVTTERKIAQEKLRSLAAELTGFSEEKWFFNYPSNKRIKQASSSLIGLSNSLISNHCNETVESNEKRVSNIRESLNIKIKDI